VNRSTVLMLLAVTASCATLSPGCDEPMPVYQEPRDILQASLVRTNTADTIYIMLDSLERQISWGTARFRLAVRNGYEDLLEGQILVSGRLNILVTSPIPRVAVVPIDRTDLLSPAIFQDHIAVPPGDSATFILSWNYFVVGASVYDDVPYTERFEGLRRIRVYQKMYFSAGASVQVFERLQAVKTGTVDFASTIITIKDH
jgi:hypothetical protein